MEEVIGEGRVDISEEGISIFIFDDLFEVIDYVFVVGSGVELDVSFDIVEEVVSFLIFFGDFVGVRVLGGFIY